VRLAFHWHFSQRLWPIAYGWASTLRIAAYAVVISVASIYMRPNGIVAETVSGVGMLALFVILVWTSILHSEERRSILGFASDRTKAIATRFALA
jgi:hypothetical protein